MTEHTIESADYLSQMFHPRKFQETVSHMITGIESKNLNFEAIAFSGTSGLMIGPSICMMMDKYPLLVRKDGDGSHSSFRIEGVKDSVNYIIVDDLTSSGGTIRRILDKLHNKTCVGIFLYSHQNYFKPSCIVEHRVWYMDRNQLHELT